MNRAAFAFAAVLVLAGRAGAEAPAPQHIAVDARGPVVLVEVTRSVSAARAEPGAGSEAIVDLSLPDGGALVSVEVRDGGRWRSVEPAVEGAARAAEVYRAEGTARRVTPASEPFDESATHRVRLLRSAGHGEAPFALRYRFVLLPTGTDGRLHVRFPASTESVPPPAEVTVRLADAAGVDIAGVPLTLGANGAEARGRASTRGAWEVSWAPRDSGGSPPPPLAGRLAVAPLPSGETAVAFLARRPAAPATELPGSVLFLVDRSRSVGLPGLSAERDLARAVIEALPPSTRFDALFFDRGTKRLFPMSRPATREAIEGFEAQMVPQWLQNGTDLPNALRDAGALLRREATTFGPRALLVLVTDGALADDVDGAALDRALGPTPGLDLSLAALTVRAVDDEPVGARARDALRVLAAARGGLARDLGANELGDGVPALLADLRRGGDLGALRLYTDGVEHRLGESLGPGALLAGVVAVKGRAPHAVRLCGTARGQKLALAPSPARVPPEWLRPWVAAGANPTRILSAPGVVAMVEPVLHAAAAADAAPKGSMDRMVIRNVLSLAYMPRARACYLNRTGATPALRDLAGRVRLAIDLARGEVNRATIASSTLGNPDIERCLTESAFEIEVPRAARSDAPVTAVLNMVFRPRTPDKKADVDLGEVGDQIDLVIEEMRRRDATPPVSPPAH